MMLSSSTRAPLAVALVLLLSSPALARAQQPAPVVPPAGEPPPPEQRAQEQAAITSQAQQTYIATHQAQFRQQAAQQVEQERRAAWEQRGRDKVPPMVIIRPPSFSLRLPGRLNIELTDAKERQLGVSADLDLRLGRHWGLGVDAGLLSFRSDADKYVPNSRQGAFVTEGSGYAIICKTTERYIDPWSMTLRVGHQLLFPFGQPSLPSAYLGFYAGWGLMFPVVVVDGGKGWLGLSFDMRIGYRFALGAGDDTPLAGAFADVLAGPVVGF